MNTITLFNLIQSANSTHPWILSMKNGIKVEHGKYCVLLTPKYEENTFMERAYLSAIAGKRWQVWNFFKSFNGWNIEIQPNEEETNEEEETNSNVETKKETKKETEETKYKNISEEFEEEEEED